MGDLGCLVDIPLAGIFHWAYVGSADFTGHRPLSLEADPARPGADGDCDRRGASFEAPWAGSAYSVGFQSRAVGGGDLWKSRVASNVAPRADEPFDSRNWSGARLLRPVRLGSGVQSATQRTCQTRAIGKGLRPFAPVGGSVQTPSLRSSSMSSMTPRSWGMPFLTTSLPLYSVILPPAAPT